MSFAIKIAKENKDVKSGKDNDLLFNSDYPLLKIHKQNSGRVVTDINGNATLIVRHEVGKIPLYFVLSEVMSSGAVKDTKLEQLPYSVYYGVNTYGFHRVIPYADRLEVQYQLSALAGRQVLKYIYYIFEDPILL